MHDLNFKVSASYDIDITNADWICSKFMRKLTYSLMKFRQFKIYINYLFNSLFPKVNIILTINHKLEYERCIDLLIQYQYNMYNVWLVYLLNTCRKHQISVYHWKIYSMYWSYSWNYCLDNIVETAVHRWWV